MGKYVSNYLFFFFSNKIMSRISKNVFLNSVFFLHKQQFISPFLFKIIWLDYFLFWMDLREIEIGQYFQLKNFGEENK